MAVGVENDPFPPMEMNRNCTFSAMCNTATIVGLVRKLGVPELVVQSIGQATAAVASGARIVRGGDTLTHID